MNALKLILALAFGVYAACTKINLPTDFSTVASGTRANLKANFDEIDSRADACFDSTDEVRGRMSGYTGDFTITSLDNLRLRLDSDGSTTGKFIVMSSNLDSLFRVSEDSTARFFGGLTVTKVTASDSLIGAVHKGTKGAFSDSVVGAHLKSVTGNLIVGGTGAITGALSSGAFSATSGSFSTTLGVSGEITGTTGIGLGLGSPASNTVSLTGLLESSANTDNWITVASHKNTDPRAGFAAVTSHGTKASPTALGATVPVVMLRGYAYQSGYFMGSSWQSYSDGAHGASNRGTFWALRAIPNGSTSSLTEWARAWRTNWLVSSINSASETPGDNPAAMGAYSNTPFFAWNAYYDPVNTPGYKFGAGSSSEYAAASEFDVSTGTYALKISSAGGNADAAATLTTAMTATSSGISIPGTLGVTGAVTGASVALGGNEAFTYDEGTYTATLTGVSGTVTGTARYVRFGKAVTLYIPQMDGTSNATTLTITGMPAGIRPARTQYAYIDGVRDNTSSDYMGFVEIQTGGTMDIWRRTSVSGGSTNAYTNSGTKGLWVGQTFTYSLL
jgi:hypothetical protein